MIKEIVGEEFRKMQLLQLDMIVEFDRICRKYDIKYVIMYGTLLGAVRHKGYIPWDDDADICMLREDYEKFKGVAYEMNPDICYFQDHYTEPEYLWQYAKLRRPNTIFIRNGQEHLKHRTGVFIDIFPFDDIPLNVIGQVWQNAQCYCLRKILWAQVACKNEKGFWKLWFTLLSQISPKWVYKKIDKWIKNSSNSSPNKVRTLLFPAPGKVYKHSYPKSMIYGIPKQWFLERAEFEFEGHKVFGPKDFEQYLKYMYEDYLTLPPENKRTPHAPVSDYQF